MSRMILLCAATIIATALIPAEAAPLSSGGEYDIETLLAEARAHYDLAQMDAVLLLEETDVTLLPTGGRETTVHRIVWIGTELATESYADLRVPYRSDRASLEVQVLRTWRDGRWWPNEDVVSPTAIVETLPGNLTTAADYIAMRETMLLHDGVELPCIVETRYAIRERELPAPGADAVWTFPQADPAVRTIFQLTVPATTTVRHVELNGAPAPETSATQSGANSMTSYVWRMNDVDRFPRPLTAEPLSYLPAVAWSTWSDWMSLRTTLASRISAALTLESELRDSLESAIADEPDARGRAKAVAEFTGKWTRNVFCDVDWWAFEPRSANRVWETAYGHSFDRAVLAIALMREAGLTACLLYTGPHGDDAMLAVPALDWFDGLRIDLAGKGEDAGWHALLDVDNGELEVVSGADAFPLALAGHLIWPSCADPMIFVGPTEGSLNVALTLSPADGDEWTGTGYLRGDGLLSPYAQMAGIAGEAEGWLTSVAGALEGASVTAHSVATFEPLEVVAGFSYKRPAGEPDDQGRYEVVIGDPGGGIAAQLPADVRLQEERRDSPVMLPGALRQRVELRIKVGERKVVYAPDSLALETGVGHENISVARDGDWLTVRRELAIDAPVISAEMWPQLRRLLLADASPRNRTLLVKKE